MKWIEFGSKRAFNNGGRGYFHSGLQVNNFFSHPVLKWLVILWVTIYSGGCDASPAAQRSSRGLTLSASEVTMARNIPFQVVDFGDTPLNSRFVPEPQALIFADQPTWERFWQTSTILDLNLQQPAAPQVDFEQRTMIGFTSGSRSTGGYAVQIDRVESVTTSQGEHWVLHYTELVPGQNCLVTQAPTTPTVFISVTPPILSIELQGQKVMVDCR